MLSVGRQMQMVIHVEVQSNKLLQVVLVWRLIILTTLMKSKLKYRKVRNQAKVESYQALKLMKVLLKFATQRQVWV